MYTLDKSLAFREARQAAWLSIWTLFGIGVAEILVSLYTNSLTLVADGLDSMADSLVSFIVWFGIRMLHRPKSKFFHFGYAKIESFSAFVAAIVIAILGVFIVYHAYERILHPIPITNVEIVMLTLLAAGGISLHRAFRVRSIAKKHNLISLTLDAKNSIKDSTASFVGFGSVLAGYFGIPYMDVMGSLAIAAYIFFMVYTALKESTLVLLDAVTNPELQQKITDIVEKKFNLPVESVLVRPLGHSLSIQLYVLMDRKVTLENFQQISNDIKKEIAHKLDAEVLVIPKLR